MGEWIEIANLSATVSFDFVSPFMGEWIEMVLHFGETLLTYVSPFMGEWIKISSMTPLSRAVMSHPSWVRR